MVHVTGFFCHLSAHINGKLLLIPIRDYKSQASKP